uniref:Endonuclease domain-containing 1 protein n=1 Tax=Dicentrarchus labrax TaxID=13489 RepID=A0A8P4G066_DICLA
MHLFCTCCVLSFSLLMASPLVSATVSDSFKVCSHFFYMQTPPAGMRGASPRKICQKYSDKLRYATLYDSSRRLPLYSAYIFKKSDGKRRMDTPWMYEPQLVSDDESGNMRALPLTEDAPPLIEDSQAVLEDYTDAVEYRRGPLNPDLHQSEPDDKSSTYTLTNVVPLITDFLDTSWNPYLDIIRRRLNNFCHGKSFMVTGVTISGAAIQRDNRDRLAIPKHVWLAYCCPRFDNNSPYESNIEAHLTMAFWVQTAFLLINIITSAVRGRVEKELSPECREFLYMGTTPTGLEHHSLQFICQRYNKKIRYVTLYNTVDHIPVYSAYTFKRSDGEKCVDVPWMYEPQLSTTSDTDEMQPFPRGYMHMNFEDAQAVLDDYTNAVLYERGTLNPDEHQDEPDDKASTYTLTNVVPMAPDFNNRVWNKQEHIVRKRLNNYCRGTAYIVTGITTSGKMIRRENMNRIAVPTYLWSAYCCVDYDHNAPYNERYKFPSFAHYGLNEDENNEVVEISVQKLKEFLKKTTFVDQNFQIFVGDCMPPASITSK